MFQLVSFDTTIWNFENNPVEHLSYDAFSFGLLSPLKYIKNDVMRHSGILLAHYLFPRCHFSFVLERRGVMKQMFTVFSLTCHDGLPFDEPGASRCRA